VQEAEVGKVDTGRVRRIMEFGAFVELFPGTDGLLHISQISKNRVRAVSDIYKEGDEVMVRVLEIDRDGKIRLSHKEFEKEGENPVTEGEGPAAGEDRAVRPEKRARGGERGDGGRDRRCRSTHDTPTADDTHAATPPRTAATQTRRRASLLFLFCPPGFFFFFFGK